jgi:GH25 family lysozyme M1 (1,4-beta-N-acetylmuramidase)
VTEDHGIDVAWPQGARYNWRQWAGKIQFGMCKATEGLDLIDPDLGDNWAGMWNLQPDHRLPRFAYHYLHPSADPAQQAHFFVSAVKSHGLLPGDNLVLDLEATDALHPPTVAMRAKTFLNEVNGLAPGHRVLVYTNPGMALAGNCWGLNPWYLWIADYGVTRPAVPDPWHNWTFWQSSGSVLDTDVFNGSTADLLAFARMPDKR